MEANKPLDPLKPPLIFNTVTTRLWLERHVNVRLEKLMAEKWGYPAPRLGVKNQNPLFIEARASVFTSFFNDLSSAVIQDVFVNRRTFEPHQDYLNTLRAGMFEVKITGKFNAAQRVDLSPVIYELAKTCVGLLETLQLPHIKKKPVDAPTPKPVPAFKPVAAPAPAPTLAPIATDAGEEGKIPLSQRELSELDKLKGRIAAAAAAASEQNIGFLIQKLKDKSKLLGSEIEALAATRSSTSELHDSLLKQRHQGIILDGLMLAQSRKRELDRLAGKASPLIIISEELIAAPDSVPTNAAPQLPVQSVPFGGRVAGLMARLRRHVAATALGFALAATGVVTAVSMTGLTTKTPLAPQLATTFKIASALPATAEVKNTAPEVVVSAAPALVTPEPLPVTVAKSTLTKEWDAPRSAVVKTPAKVAGIVFTYVTNDTLGKMCSEMRARNIETWACEQQPQ